MILNGYAQYVIDGEWLLMLHYDDENEQIGVDGQELLDSCPRLSEMINDRASLTFDCYVIDIRGEAIRVTCPQYDGFDCTDPHFTDEQREYLKNELPVIKLVECDATYLLWLDCSQLNVPSKVLSGFLRQNQGLFLSAGIDFGQCGDNFLRMNIACPQELLKDGLGRLKAGRQLAER